MYTSIWFFFSVEKYLRFYVNFNSCLIINIYFIIFVLIYYMLQINVIVEKIWTFHTNAAHIWNIKYYLKNTPCFFLQMRTSLLIQTQNWYCAIKLYERKIGNQFFLLNQSYCRKNGFIATVAKHRKLQINNTHGIYVNFKYTK